MQTSTNSFSTIDRYHDGIRADYSTLIRMWSAFDRSLATFNRKCGALPRKPNRKNTVADNGRRDR